MGGGLCFTYLFWLGEGRGEDRTGDPPGGRIRGQCYHPARSDYHKSPAKRDTPLRVDSNHSFQPWIFSKTGRFPGDPWKELHETCSPVCPTDRKSPRWQVAVALSSGLPTIPTSITSIPPIGGLDWWFEGWRRFPSYPLQHQTTNPKHYGLPDLNVCMEK